MSTSDCEEEEADDCCDLYSRIDSSSDMDVNAVSNANRLGNHSINHPHVHSQSSHKQPSSSAANKHHLHSANYVNLLNHHHHHHHHNLHNYKQQNEGLDDSSSSLRRSTGLVASSSSSNGNNIDSNAYSQSSLSRRDKSRSCPRAQQHGGGRKSRSRDRADVIDNKSSMITGNSSTTPGGGGDCIITEREKELELIHRRSRELLLSPRTMNCRSRDGSMDRYDGKGSLPRSPGASVSSSGVSSSKPPPLPPRLHSPMNNNNNNTSQSGRYKSPSPCAPGSGYYHHHHNHLYLHRHHHQPQPPHPPPQSNQAPPPPYRQSLRRRVQSPNRRDFKDFSNPRSRDLRSPMKHIRSYLDEEEDSGADSLGNDQPGSPCVGCCSNDKSSSGGNNNALVVYDHHRSDSSPPMCCESYCPIISHHPSPSLSIEVEERLRCLEGDKDTLHMQVAVLSRQIDGQTNKIYDLEKVLDDKKDVLRKTEDVLSREMLSRSSLETKKLELLSEIANLKLKQAATERENTDLRTKLEYVTKYPPEPSHVFAPSLFGTTPRRPRARSSNNNKTPSLPLETHFDYEENERSRRAPPPSSCHRRSPPSHGGSAPNLVALSERKTATSTFKRNYSRNSVEKAVVSSVVSNPIATKPKGLKKIWGKMRRSNSGNLIEQEHSANENNAPSHNNGGNESRNSSSSTNSNNTNRNSGGEDSKYRNSGGSRFAGWMMSGLPESHLPFRQWKVDTIISWLDHLGLYMYSSEVRKHVKTGDDLLKMVISNVTSEPIPPISSCGSDLEIKLGIKHVLHRKKLVLALNAKAESEVDDLAGRLDHHWVVRWLDDVGLPQYKDTFLEARIDGRVLNFLTVEDLFHLKITNMLHHLSLRRGVQVLRSSKFEPGCIKRRADPGDDKDRYSSPTEVTLWSNHRVMEWLRHIDLAEYASNLRGSGVHGALIVFEPKFNAELMASLLSIPVNKSLLRRHLTLHFRNLVGRDRMIEKREAQEANNALLTPTAKVKTQKRQFPLARRKKSKHELDLDDLICPMEEDDEE
ncbi:LOW QUALITY PROTEIN: uncharacterized protein [Lepeophtheirus salmonis]|uniref:LOW QUALITY PROTEIN: uncharacterized protein n=1 Tax=Lepeophtheirus salmonis TaxID=72036 RepID=UPI001AE9C363|nr:LOW QUALITY PROTEIN: liprin-beta-1-like [Lepeophtheirus salmonis]